MTESVSLVRCDDYDFERVQAAFVRFHPKGWRRRIPPLWQRWPSWSSKRGGIPSSSNLQGDPIAPAFFE